MTSEARPSPLSEADPRSLDEVFSSRPPFDPSAMRRAVEEFRRMRVKWQQDAAEGKSKRVAKRGARPTAPVGDIFGEDV